MASQASLTSKPQSHETVSKEVFLWMTPKVVFWPPHMGTWARVPIHVCAHTYNKRIKKMTFQVGQIPKHPGSSSATRAEKQSLSSQGSSGIQQHTLPSPLHPNKAKGHQPPFLGRQTTSPSGAWARARFQKLSRKTKKIQSGNHHVGAHGHLHFVLPACPQVLSQLRR